MSPVRRADLVSVPCCEGMRDNAQAETRGEADKMKQVRHFVEVLSDTIATRFSRSIALRMNKFWAILCSVAVIVAVGVVSDTIGQRAMADDTTVADASTLSDWENYLNNAGGKATTQHVGRIWTDKSVSTQDVTLTRSGVTTSKTISKGDSDFLIGLSALSSTSNLATTTAKPLDISLVLDVSGSMAQHLINYAEVYGNTNGIKDTGGSNDYSQDTEYYTFDESGNLITLQWKRKPRNLDASRPYGWRDSDAGDRTGESSKPEHWYTPIRNAGEQASGQRVQFYEAHDSGITKLVALKKAVRSFIDNTAKQNQNITDSADKHHISLVKFADSSVPQTCTGWGRDYTCVDNPDEVGNDFNGDYNRTQIVADLTDDADALKTAVGATDNDGLTQGGATAADYGFQMAARALSTKHGGRDNAQKVVIFFTDGEPNHHSGWDADVANSAIQEAKNLKDKDTLIYSIGVFGNADPSVDPNGSDASNFSKYMHGVSSNYKVATSLTDLGSRTKKDGKDANYYFASDTPEELDKVFQDIAADIQHSTVGSPTNAVEGAQDTSGYITFDDQLGDYMKVDDFTGILYADNVYEKTGITTENNVDTYVFGHAVTGNAVYPVSGNLKDILITVTRSGGSAGDKVQVKIPASLIPLRNFKVSKAADGTSTMDVAEAYPIRVFYGVSMKSGVADRIANGTFDDAAYVDAHTSADGKNVYFYSNLYEDKKTGEGKTVGDTVASYEPASNNVFYYFTADTPVYKDAECTQPVTQSDAFNEADTYYYKHTYVEKDADGTVAEKTAPVAFKGTSFEAAQGRWTYDDDGELYVKAGTPRLTRTFDFSADKEGQRTDTAQTFIDTEWDDYANPKNIHAYLGNNGRIAKALRGTLAVAKTVSVAAGLDESDYANKGFSFTVHADGVVSTTRKAEVKKGGTVTKQLFDLSFDAGGNATQTLKDGETLYVYGLADGTKYSVTETGPGTGWTSTSSGDNGTIVGNQTSTATFTNHYAAAAVTVRGANAFDGEKILSGRDWLASDKFVFAIDGVDAASKAKLPNTTTVEVRSGGTHDGTAVPFSFGDVTYDEPGTFTYQIYESEEGSTIDAGVSASQALYEVTVVVSDNGSGQLAASSSMTKIDNDDGSAANNASVNKATFTNNFSATAVGWNLSGIKQYTDNSGKKPLARGMFHFRVTAHEADAPMPSEAGADQSLVITADASGSLAFDQAQFTDAMVGRTFTYTIAEVVSDGKGGWVDVKDAIAVDANGRYVKDGMTYDPSVQTVNVTVGTEKDAQGNAIVKVTPVYSNGKNRFEFSNSYTPTPLTLAINGGKTLTGRDARNGEKFTFALSAGNDVTKEALADDSIVFGDDADAVSLSAEVSDARNGVERAFSFNGVKFTKPGTYTFEVKETKGDKPGLAYDEHTAVVTVEVSDVNGVLTGTPIYDNDTDKAPDAVKTVKDKAAFRNTYSASNSYRDEGGLHVTKTLAGRNMTNAEFSFTITGGDGTGTTADDANAKLADADRSFANGPKAEGVADVMDKLQGVTFTEADAGKTYVYIVDEGVPTGASDDDAAKDGFQYQGVTYDQSEYRVEIAVADDGDGSMTVTTTIKRSKDANGSVLTQPQEVGSYSSKDDLQPIAFANAYAAKSVTVDTSVGAMFTKHVSGRDWQDGERYSFTIANTGKPAGVDVAPMPNDISRTVSRADLNSGSDTDADFDFGELTFTKTGAYTYEVRETVPEAATNASVNGGGTQYKDATVEQRKQSGWKLNGVSYSSNVGTLTITVTDPGDGQLVARVAAGSRTFSNQYSATGRATLKATKTLTGRAMRQGEFAFAVSTNPESGAGREVTTGTNAATGAGVAADIDFDDADLVYTISDLADMVEAGYAKTGTSADGKRQWVVSYTAAEDTSNLPQGVTAGASSFDFTVTVVDQGDGTLKATVNYPDGAAALEFRNQYSTTGTTASLAGFNKVLAGRGWKRGDAFTFTLTAKDGAPLPTGSSVTAVGGRNDQVKTTVTSSTAKSGDKVPFGFGSVAFKDADMTGATLNGDGKLEKTFVYTVQEDVSSLPAGVTPQSKGQTATVTITVTDNGDGTMTAVPSVTNGEFTNVYTAEVDYSALGGLNITKTLIGRDMTDGQFAFTVSNADEKTLDKLGLTTAKDAYAAPAAQDGQAAEVNLLAGTTVTFTDADAGKTYAFDLTETRKGGSSYANDETPRHVEIVPTFDAATGVLTVTTTVTKAGEQVAQTVITSASSDAQPQVARVPFVNRYSATGSIPASGDARLKATKTLTGRDMASGEFAFDVKFGDVVIATGSNAAAADGQAGDITFTPIAFSNAAETADTGTLLLKQGRRGTGDKANVYTYRFTVAERTDGLADKGITASNASYAVTVEVTDNGDGTLTPQIVYPDDSLAFVNAYGSNEVSVAIKGTKAFNVTNGNLTTSWADVAKNFTFTITGSEGAPMPAKTTVRADSATGQIDFGSVVYEQPAIMDGIVVDQNGMRNRTFTYTVTENGAAGGVVNGEAQTFTVTLTENTRTGGLVAEVAPARGASDGSYFTITNSYAVQSVESSITDEGQLKVSKTISGRPLVDGEFRFAMTEGDVVATGTNDADGKVSFSKITYTEPGEHDYTIREIQSDDSAGVAFDAKTVAAHASVTDRGDGTLAVAWAFSGGADGREVTFENGYKPAGASVRLGAAKRLEGRDLKGGEFSFELRGANGEVIDTSRNKADGQIMFKALDYAKPGTYEYTISEVKGDTDNVTYDTTVHKVVVTVTDDLQGHLTAEIAYADGKAPVFVNSYNKPVLPIAHTGADVAGLVALLILLLGGAGVARRRR